MLFRSEITALHCTYDDTTKGGWSDDGRKVKGTMHWVSAEHAVNAKVNLYEKLFTVDNPAKEADFTTCLNPNSLTTVDALVEPSLLDSKPLDKFQFERTAYFCVDKDSSKEQLIFNRTVTLRG